MRDLRSDSGIEQGAAWRGCLWNQMLHPGQRSSRNLARLRTDPTTSHVRIWKARRPTSAVLRVSRQSACPRNHERASQDSPVRLTPKALPRKN